MNKIKIFFCFCSIFLPIIGFGSNLLPEKKKKMVQHLDMIQNIFEVHYAPRIWKLEYFQWELENEIEKMKNEILSSEQFSIVDYQRLLKKFAKSTKDYHVRFLFHSTEKAELPFTVLGANGRYFFIEIDQNKLSPYFFPINVGDELITFDGRPIIDVIEEIKRSEVTQSNRLTDDALASLYLTQRRAYLGDVVPRGPVSISARSKDGQEHSYQLLWEYTPEEIQSWSEIPFASFFSKRNLTKNFFSKYCISPLFFSCFSTENGQDFSLEASLVGSRESFTPPLGKIWWQTSSSSPFHAYIFQNSSKQLIGYIRISDYKGGDIFFGEPLKEFGKIIDLFQERTEALIIDQVNNPGGLVFYCFALASMLTDKPLVTPKQRVAIMQKDVSEALEVKNLLLQIDSEQKAVDLLGEEFFGYPVNYQFVQFGIEYCRFIIDQWNDGKTITDPTHIFGIDHINPHPSHRYTKPLLILANELSFSCADFFPTMMQENKRGPIFGTPTAGAGGWIDGASYPNHFGVDHLVYTASIAERADKKPIENLGVTPDIFYAASECDLQEGYQEYKIQVLDALDQLLRKNSEESLSENSLEEFLHKYKKEDNEDFSDFSQ